jgi:hypothetical protein
MLRGHCSSALRVVRTIVVICVAGVLGLWALPAHADEGDAFIPGLTIDQATITGPSLDEPRTLGAADADTFMKSWFATSIVGQVEQQRPPKDAPVYRIVIRYTYEGTLREMTAWYATTEGNAWVGMPEQDLMPGMSVSSDAWIVAPDATRNAIRRLGLPTAAAERASTPTASSSSSGGGAPWLALLLAALAVLVVVAGAGVWRARRSRPEPGKPGEPGEPDEAGGPGEAAAGRPVHA